MLIVFALRTAIWGIVSSPYRSLALVAALTSAVAAVIFSSSILGGFSADLERLAFGNYATTLVVSQNPMVVARRAGPSIDDLQRLEYELDHVESSAAWIETKVPIRTADETLNISVYGALGDYRKEVDADLLEGEWLIEDQLGSLQRVCLIGASLAYNLKHEELSLVGRRLQLGGHSCMILGVLDYANTRPAARFNEAVIAPFGTVHRYYNPPSNGATPVHPRMASWISLFMSDKVDMNKARFQADKIMRKASGVGFARESPYGFNNPTADLISQVKQKQALSNLLTTITTGTLIASLIGYAGIALSSTASRTREIALRMAMGATRRGILQQITTEHLLIGVVSSAIGLGLGFGLSSLVSKLWEWPIRLSVSSAVLAISIGLCTGLLIGALTAWKAANTPPSLAAKT